MSTATGLTLLMTSRGDHLNLGRAMWPICGSRAKVTGFHYSAEGHLDSTVKRMCPACLGAVRSHVDLDVERAS